MIYGSLAGTPFAADEDTIVALPVAWAPGCRVGRDSSGQPCVFIPSSHSRRGADLRLRNIQARQGVRCRIDHPDGSTESALGMLVLCRAEQPAMARLFLAMMTDALAELGPEPSGEVIADWIQRVATLFSRLEVRGQTELRGLWAELLVINELGNPGLLARRWHADPQERYDFLSGTFALEVKSCQDLDRVHYFSLEQLRPPEAVEAWLSSVVVRLDPSGTSTLELLREIEARTPDPAVRSALRTMVFTMAGAALAEDDQHRFDAASARATLKIMDIRVVPSLEGDVPAEVLGVTLRVRCRDVPAIEDGPTRALARLA